MKKTIKLVVVAALGATSAFATNGATLIGMGAKSRGMAGTGIAMSHGAESALTNPALITSVESIEISFGGTLFMPDVENTQTVYPTGTPPAYTATSSSDADMNVIPEVSLAAKINDNFYVGVGMWGTGGMGVDYREATTGTQFQMVTNLQLMEFGVPLAYKVDGLSVALTPILQYGSLDINYNNSNNIGAGVAQDFAFGYNIGVAYEISGITVGAVYKSRIDMDYKDQLVNAMAGFGVAYTNTELSSPAEIGVGASYTVDEHTVALDYKRIKWSDAKGYKDFKWDDQNVITLGYEYKTKEWSARAGYNYASSPIQNLAPGSLSAPAGSTFAGDYAGLLNTFNLLGFPGIVESHYAVGGSYNISKQVSVDLAFTYASEVTETFKNFAGLDITTKHSQTGVSAQLTFDF